MNKKQLEIISYFNNLKIFKKKGSLGSINKLKYYLSYLFRNIELKNKKVLDIGSGYGLYTSYIAAGGASLVYSVEPELDGGTNKMIETIKTLKTQHDLQSIVIEKELFQNLNINKKFDVILLHNCINHLNEDACESLLSEDDAQEEYLMYFKKLRKLLLPHGRLIITDVERDNFFNQFNLNNPFAPSIEYNKHQNANVWLKIAEKSGMKLIELDYNKFNFFGPVVRNIIPKKIAKYVFGTGFKIVLTTK